ncbi:TonB-dependent receptor [Polymorphobacter fuscus]|uniref:TonB-dependent receptor n=1 Tax=Sandarakinorhabdus fusca TaxID=1439888 RepID=A0A7C9GQR2_9SPHN|nr:TonB-dependent receptor [Polymorphobacter fuscus]KAB7645467.1 TonB-dependent receptor [Polymorphobacter fuscus]MQT17896.1 TonB-dependent receptor [Polymorphobacter fuscus]NJC08525.1 outer membrane receptor protein involved in Fe transport [Polymorphobacter fuscus]
MMDVAPAEIVVTGQALPAPSGAAAYSTVTIDSARLATTASGRIEDALKDVAGLVAFRRTDSRSANPTSQGVTLRALGGNAASRALVLLDGVPVADPFAGYIPWSAIDPSRLASVSVVRGGGAGAFGAGAVAGTLNLSSGTPATLAPVSLGIAGGSRGSWEAAGGVTAQLGQGFVSVSGRYDEGDGYVLLPENQRGPIDIPARYKSWGASIRAVVPVSDATEVQVTGRAFDDERVRGIELVNSRTRGADASVRVVHRGDWGAEALAYVQTRDFAAGFASVNAARTTATPTLDQYRTPATGIGGKIELRPPLGAAHDLQIGIDARRGDGASHERFRLVNGFYTRLREAGGATSTVGVYAEDSWKLNDLLTLTGGVRADRWAIAQGRLIERDSDTGAVTQSLLTPARDGWRATARGGAVVTLAPALALRGAAYTGFRLPTPNELYRPFRVGADATAANPALDLERARGVEAGFDWRPIPTARLSVTAYANELAGAIANVTLGRGPGNFPQVGFVAANGSFRQRLNLDRVVVHGVEADASVSAGPWSAQGSLAWADPQVRASGPAAGLDGLRPAASPQLSASGTLAWTGTRLGAGVTLRHFGAQFDDDQNLRRIAPATTLDASARLGLWQGVSVEVRAENITDATVVSGVGADGLIDRAQPRTLWLGLRWQG